MISAKQCRAARQLLGWKQGFLATESGVSLSTVSTFEKECLGSAATIDDLQAALENAGVIFLDGHGVKLRAEESISYRGTAECGKFFEHLALLKGGEVFAYMKSIEVMNWHCGTPRKPLIGHLNDTNKAASVKCLLADARPVPFLKPSFEVRVVPYLAVAPTSFFIYDGKLALLTFDSRSEMNILVSLDTVMAREYAESFTAFWSSMDRRDMAVQPAYLDTRVAVANG